MATISEGTGIIPFAGCVWYPEFFFLDRVGGHGTMSGQNQQAWRALALLGQSAV
jgi:hypothetical protein